MKRTVWLQETKQMRFDAPHPWGAPCMRPTDVTIRSRRISEEAYSGWTERRLTQEDAAWLLGVCARTFRRYIDRYEVGKPKRKPICFIRRWGIFNRPPWPGMLLHQDDNVNTW